MLRNVPLLALCQTIFQSGNIHLTTSGSIIALALGANEALATWPASVSVITALAMTMPASFIMARFGRRAGFLLALLFGAAGATVAAFGIISQSFGLFLLSAILLGALFGFTNYLRFAAVEIVAEPERTRAISLVLAGGVFAALLGPSMTSLGYHLVAGFPFAGGYLLFLPLYVLAVVLLFAIRFRPPLVTRPRLGSSLAILLRDRGFLRIVFLGTGAYVTMVLLMTATPLAMHHEHLGFEATTQVIRAHVLGMFVPSFFTGHIIGRFGIRRVIAAGAVLFAICIGVNFTGSSYWHFMSSLILLGIGWNFLFVSASRLLTAEIAAEHQTSAQALNDFVIAAGAALSISFTGKLHQLIGWQYLNLAALPLVVLLLAAGFSDRVAAAENR